jgi:hypothetical protein
MVSASDRVDCVNFGPAVQGSAGSGRLASGRSAGGVYWGGNPSGAADFTRQTILRPEPRSCQLSRRGNLLASDARCAGACLSRPRRADGMGRGFVGGGGGSGGLIAD